MFLRCKWYGQGATVQVAADWPRLAMDDFKHYVKKLKLMKQLRGAVFCAACCTVSRTAIANAIMVTGTRHPTFTACMACTGVAPLALAVERMGSLSRLAAMMQQVSSMCSYVQPW